VKEAQLERRKSERKAGDEKTEYIISTVEELADDLDQGRLVGEDIKPLDLDQRQRDAKRETERSRKQEQGQGARSQPSTSLPWRGKAPADVSRSAYHGAAAMRLRLADLAVARLQRLRLGKLRFSFTQ